MIDWRKELIPRLKPVSRRMVVWFAFKAILMGLFAATVIGLSV